MTPDRLTPSTLTAVGVIGAVIGSIGLVACHWSDAWLVVVVLGISLNWLGDSLDGSLARYRGLERPRLGFMVDHTCDLFSNLLLIVSFGFSPFMSVFSALIVLQSYLLLAAYTYVIAASYGVHTMGYGGLGATEFRILMILYAVLSAAFDNRKPFQLGYSSIDLIIASFATIIAGALVVRAFKDAKKIALLEQHERSRSGAHLHGTAPPKSMQGEALSDQAPQGANGS
jgi:phosphatidylglycerophosphate synthase